jgi:hypothetical protein
LTRLPPLLLLLPLLLLRPLLLLLPLLPPPLLLLLPLAAVLRMVMAQTSGSQLHHHEAAPEARCLQLPAVTSQSNPHVV